MRRMTMGAAGLAAALAACDGTMELVSVTSARAPVDLRGWYYHPAVELEWRLGASWGGETFRVYGKRLNDAEFRFIAEITSCKDDRCQYRDLNVSHEVTYEYYVAAVNPGDGVEVPSDYSVEVHVPSMTLPPTPRDLTAVALDGAVYLRWAEADGPGEVWGYQVYAAWDDVDSYLLGVNDSPAFVDLHARNGETSKYHVTAIDHYGRESAPSARVESTPRPDYVGEFVYSSRHVPDSAGFRFRESGDVAAVTSGDSPGRHLAVEGDSLGLWFAPGPGVGVHPEQRATSALKCALGADANCASWERAPTRGYVDDRIEAVAGYTYMFQVPDHEGTLRYGAVRVAATDVDQMGREFVVFDWAYQTQAGNPSLTRAAGSAGD